jgi:hypothetical protein
MMQKWVYLTDYSSILFRTALLPDPDVRSVLEK